MYLRYEVERVTFRLCAKRGQSWGGWKRGGSFSLISRGGERRGWVRAEGRRDVFIVGGDGRKGLKPSISHQRFYYETTNAWYAYLHASIRGGVRISCNHENKKTANSNKGFRSERRMKLYSFQFSSSQS